MTARSLRRRLQHPPQEPPRIRTPALEGLVGALPAVNAALQAEGKYVALVPPAELQALRAGELQWMYDRKGRQLANLVGEKGRIQRKARLVPLGPEAATAAVFQLLSVVTSQYYLHKINKELGAVKEQLRSVHDRQVDAHRGEVMGAADIVREIHELTMDAVEAGGDLSSLPEPSELWSRLAVAELPLRSATAAAELALERILGELREGFQDEGTKRRVARRRDEQRAYGHVLEWSREWGSLWSMATQAMSDWYSVVLVRSLLLDSPTLKTRLTQYRGVWESKKEFLEKVTKELDWLTGQPGEHWFDTAVDLVPGIVADVAWRVQFPMVSVAVDAVNSVREGRYKPVRLPIPDLGLQTRDTGHAAVVALADHFARLERTADLAARGLQVEEPRAMLLLEEEGVGLFDEGRLLVEKADYESAYEEFLSTLSASQRELFLRVSGR